MGTFQKILLTAVALTLVAVTALTWGSVGSVMTGFCLIAMISALLFQRFVTNRDEDPFRWEE